MKLVVISILIVAVSAADVNWNKVVPRHNVKDGQIVNPKITSFSNGRNGRIVGGAEAWPNSHPYVVALIVRTFGTDALCQGSIISMDTILTSAFCIIDSENTQVIAGAHDVTRMESTQQRRIVPASSYRIHPGYDNTVNSIDIATLLLSSPLIENQYVKRVMLPTTRRMMVENFAGELATVSGILRCRKNQTFNNF